MDTCGLFSRLEIENHSIISSQDCECLFILKRGLNILYIDDRMLHVALTGTDPHVTEHDVSKLDALAFRAGLDHVRPAGRLRV